jgi:hypothetical protein
MDKLMIVRIIIILICGGLLFATRKYQSNENQKPEPRKSILLITKILNLIFAALIALSVLGQIIDLTSRSKPIDPTSIKPPFEMIEE